MSRIFTTCSPLVSESSTPLPDCLIRVMDELTVALRSIDLSVILTYRSRGLHKEIEKIFSSRDGWSWGKRRLLGIESASSNRAMFKLDGTIKCDGHCESIHRVNIVLCSNNREAIGGNLLKMELASTLLPQDASLGILICMTRKLMELGGWDGSYADNIEYQEAYCDAYRDFLKSRIAILTLNA